MRKYVIVVAIMAAAAVPAQARTQHSHGCHTHACEVRVCKSHACQQRVWRKHHPVARVSSADQAWLYRVRMCESGGNYRIDTDNGFYGAYQFTLSSWAAVGGRGYPNQAPPWEQDMRALRLRAVQGTGAWPNCG
jgi:hypothetical protein